MNYPRTKEGYALFLQSEFWITLSRLKRSQVVKCEMCGSRERLQSHHIRYQDDWMQTKLDDLIVLCRYCHEIAHGLGGRKIIKRLIKKKKRKQRGNRKSPSKKKRLEYNASIKAKPYCWTARKRTIWLSRDRSSN